MEKTHKYYWSLCLYEQLWLISLTLQTSLKNRNIVLINLNSVYLLTDEAFEVHVLLVWWSMCSSVMMEGRVQQSAHAHTVLRGALISLRSENTCVGGCRGLLGSLMTFKCKSSRVLGLELIIVLRSSADQDKSPADSHFSQLSLGKSPNPSSAVSSQSCCWLEEHLDT